jgi:hypothetical protein
MEDLNEEYDVVVVGTGTELPPSPPTTATGNSIATPDNIVRDKLKLTPHLRTH